ncbi:MAG: hypothetical protein R8L53_04755 [Mariprofundales bacterium]
MFKTRNILFAVLLLLGMAALPSAAMAAITAGGATIHNAATLTFTGGTAYAQVNVGVQTIASAPTIAVDSVAQSVNANTAATYTYTITSNTNGSDSFSFAAAVADQYTVAVAGLNVNATGTASTTLTLGASVASQASDAAGKVYIPSGSQVNLAVGNIIVISGVGTYTIASVAAGTIATTNNTTGVTTAETPATLTLTPAIGSPVIGLNTVAAGAQIGEQVTFNTVVTASSATTAGTAGTHTVNLSGATTATTTAGAVVNYNTSTGAANETITTVLSPGVSLVKKVRNVTKNFPAGAGVYAAAGVNAQSGDTLEYQLVATEGTGLSAATGNVLTDNIPPFTTYVASSTTLNAIAAADVAGASPLVAGLSLNSAGQAAGTIAAGATATVIFQVTVD